jgi:hypothetical protein
MPLKDYQDIVTRLQKGLARAWAEDPLLLNLPGRSLACKIEPDYYLALQPAFVEHLARFAAVLPKSVTEALLKTGLLVSAPPERAHVLTVGVIFGGRRTAVRASFVDADFIDRALKLYAGQPAGLEISELRLQKECRAELAAFFKNKTPPRELAYL